MFPVFPTTVPYIPSKHLLIKPQNINKARKSISNYEKQPPLPSSNTRSSLSVSTESKSATAQAYVDLLKASYILYEIVLKNQNTEAPLLTDENRKLFYNLSDVCSNQLPSTQQLGKKVVFAFLSLLTLFATGYK